MPKARDARWRPEGTVCRNSHFRVTLSGLWRLAVMRAAPLLPPGSPPWRGSFVWSSVGQSLRSRWEDALVPHSSFS